MNFSEQPPSKQWSTLKYRGEKFAEVWFKPEGEPFSITFRIPQSSFLAPGMGQLLTTANLLKAVGIAAEEVESWRTDGASSSGTDGLNPELDQPLSPPAEDVPYLNLHLNLTQPTPVAVSESSESVAANETAESVVTSEMSKSVAANETTESVAASENSEPEIPEAKWQYLEARWNAIRGLEVSMDTLRLSLDGLRAEMEAAAKKPLKLEAKLHALSTDLVLWNKAKSRVHYAVPKVKEFIHRFTWAKASAERKKIEELFDHHIRTRIPFPQVDQAVVQFDSLLKDRQVLSASGVSVYQECKSILTNIQGTLRTLETNAASNAIKKKSATRTKGKSF